MFRELREQQRRRHIADDLARRSRKHEYVPRVLQAGTEQYLDVAGKTEKAKKGEQQPVIHAQCATVQQKRIGRDDGDGGERQDAQDRQDHHDQQPPVSPCRWAHRRPRRLREPDAALADRDGRQQKHPQEEQ